MTTQDLVKQAREWAQITAEKSPGVRAEDTLLWSLADALERPDNDTVAWMADMDRAASWLQARLDMVAAHQSRAGVDRETAIDYCMMPAEAALFRSAMDTAREILRRGGA